MSISITNKTTVRYTYYLPDGTRINDVSYSNIWLGSQCAPQPPENVKADLSMILLSNVYTIEPGGDITYTILLQNYSTCDLENITFKDNLSSDVDFIPGSVVVNNKRYPELNITKGIYIICLFSKSTIVLQFRVRHNLNSVRSIVNTATASLYIRYHNKTLEKYRMVSNTSDIRLTINGLYLYLKLNEAVNIDSQRIRYIFAGYIENQSDVILKNVTLKYSFYPECWYSFQAAAVDDTWIKTDRPLVIDNMKPGEVKNIMLVLVFNRPFDSSAQFYFTAVKSNVTKPMIIESNHKNYYN